MSLTDNGPRVVVAILTERNGVPNDEIFNRFIAIARRGHAFLPCTFMRTETQRNLLAGRLLESDYTHLLMLDADHLHPVDVVERLTAHMMADPAKLVVSGFSFRRGPPFDPAAWYEGMGCVHPMLQWPAGLIQVDLIGGFCTLVNREVFERLEWPWFRIMCSIKDRSFGGEDIYFSRKCWAAGIDLWVDTDCISPHLTQIWVTEATYRQYLAEMERRQHGTDEGGSDKGD